MLAPMSGDRTDLASVWKLVERADEFVKYAQNRDPAAAYRQARQALGRAAEAAADLPERPREGIMQQIERRLADLDRLEGEPS